MQPGPWMLASVKVVPALITTDGEIFQPWPNFLAACCPVPWVAIPPLPFSPVKFSGLMERDRAFEVRQRFASKPADESGGSAARITDTVVIKKKETNSKCSDNFIDTYGSDITVIFCRKEGSCH